MTCPEFVDRQDIAIPVLMMSTGLSAQDQKNFVRTSKFFSFYLDIYKGFSRKKYLGVLKPEF
jgi:hypothetical protein